MGEVRERNRPLSPHLTIYKLPLAARMSIMHRITGVGLTLGAVLGVWWFLAAASGPEYFAFVDGLVTSWIGGLIMLLSMFALWFHFFTGVRHLVWDTGYGFGIEEVDKSSYAVFAGAGVMSLITLLYAF